MGPTGVGLFVCLIQLWRAWFYSYIRHSIIGVHADKSSKCRWNVKAGSVIQSRMRWSVGEVAFDVSW